MLVVHILIVIQLLYVLMSEDSLEKELINLLCHYDLRGGYAIERVSRTKCPASSVVHE